MNHKSVQASSTFLMQSNDNTSAIKTSSEKAGESESKQSHVVKEDTTYVERRADIGMFDISMERPSILIDCTMVAPNAAYIKDYANSGQAAELTTKRKGEYCSKHFDIADTTRVSLVIFAL